jgi:hypothetical protein
MIEGVMIMYKSNLSKFKEVMTPHDEIFRQSERLERSITTLWGIFEDKGGIEPNVTLTSGVGICSSLFVKDQELKTNSE